MLLAWPILVCILMYLSFIGWGQFIVNNDKDTNFAMAGAYGLAWACLVGGILNLFQLISQDSIQVFLTIGILSWVIHVVKNSRKIRLSSHIVFSLFNQNKIPAFIFGVMLLISLTYGSLPFQNNHDDNHGYLVFPHQMLDTGHIGDNPYSERRLGVLGGQSFLNAMTLTLVSYKQLKSFDAIAGWLVFIMLVAAHSLRLNLSGLTLLFLLSLWHWIIPPAPNISSTVTSLALFYAFLCRFHEAGLHQRINEIFKTSIIVAALISLKTSNIAGLVFLGPFVFLLDRRIRYTDGLQQGIKVATVSLILVSPWMLAMYQSSGTFLFPLLGQGTHTNWNQGAALLSIRLQDINWIYIRHVLYLTLTMAISIGGILFFGLGFLKYKQALKDINPAAVSAFLAAMLATLCLSFVSLALFRYSYPFSFAAFIFLVTEALSNKTYAATTSVIHDTNRNQNRYLLAWLTITIYMGVIWTGGLNHLSNKINRISNFTVDTLQTFPRSIIETAQNTTLPKSSILAVLSHPYLMEFSRNHVFVIDHAGSAGPDHGLPIYGTADELSVYLRKQKIDYLIYSYADNGGYAAYKYRLTNSRGTPYDERVRILVENNFKFYNLIVELTKIHKVIHQDKYSLVINLNEVNASPLLKDLNSN
jgi:hypothetical protein